MSDPSAAPPLDLEADPMTPAQRVAQFIEDEEIEHAAGESGSPTVTPRLVLALKRVWSEAEHVERLRGLLERAADAITREREGSLCTGCLDGVSLAPKHAPGCPWPELEAAVLSWRKP